MRNDAGGTGTAKTDRRSSRHAILALRVPSLPESAGVRTRRWLWLSERDHCRANARRVPEDAPGSELNWPLPGWSPGILEQKRPNLRSREI